MFILTVARQSRPSQSDFKEPFESKPKDEKAYILPVFLVSPIYYFDKQLIVISVAFIYFENPWSSFGPSIKYQHMETTLIQYFFLLLGKLHISNGHLARVFLCLLIGGGIPLAASAQETIPAGSFIINMGVTPQTDANGLKPYGMVYDLLENYQVPIKWVINPAKAKDGTDFTFNGVDYKGGTFIIPAEYRTATVNARITFWQGQNVVGVTTTTPITVPVYTTLYAAPSWTINSTNNDIVTDFFTRAGVPTSAYNFKAPSALGPCDDIFAMPHADPKWVEHNNLLAWNQNHQGSIWYGCHSGSALEDMFNPANPSQQSNFLAEKTGVASLPGEGAGPYFQNALVLWSTHNNVGFSAPFQYDYPTDPIMQFMGTIDAALVNGSEKVYITKNAGWRPTTKVGVFDPDHPLRPSGAIQHRAAITAWGRGFGDSNRGWVLMQGGHDVGDPGKDGPYGPANVAAQRIFFNLAFLAVKDKVVIPSITGITTPASVAPGDPVPFSFTIPAPANPANYTIAWTSDCGGSFSPSSTAQNVTYTPPAGPGPYTCKITLVITDPCGRKTFDTKVITVVCNLTASTTLSQPCFGGGTNGSIAMTLTGGTAPFSYSWTRTGGGSGSGTGTTISGLSAGTYNITVTASNGCVTTLSRTLTELPQLTATATPTPVQCNGQATGSISVTVSGGSPAYSYLWTGGVTTQNRSGLTAGTYNLTVTDSRSCTATASATINQPTLLNASIASITNVNCFGEPTGAINLNVSGGTAPYTYLWNGGVTSPNRSGLAAGTYSVTVTDANSCTRVLTGIVVNQPAAALSLTSTQVNANCGGNTGSATVIATGGTTPYSYNWSGTPTGDGTATITGLAGGTYAVTVTDARGCTAVRSVTITQPAPLALSVVPTNPSCPPGATPPLNSNGAINLTVTGGTTPYTYLWTASGGGVIPGGQSTMQDLTMLVAGTYTVVVTDANGCTATTSVTLVFQNQLPVTPPVINKN